MSVLKIKDALGNWIKILTIKGDKGDTGNQGAQGIPGVSPTVSVSDIPGGHRVTITDAEYPQGISFDVMDGSDADAPVQDVTVDGASIIGADGVAAIQTAKDGSLGVVQFEKEYGIGLYAGTHGKPRIFTSSIAQVKGGAQSYKPIVPSNQDQSVFYGLAKAAGADMKDITSTTVGTYPEAQKVAIQKMLGVYEAPWELIREDTFTNVTEADHIISTDALGQAFELTDMYLEIWLTADTQEASVGSGGRIDTYYSDNGFFTQYLGAATVAVGGYTKGSWLLIENEKGAIIRQNTVYATMGTDRNAVAAPSRVDTNRSYVIFGNYIFNKIVIKAMTGTGNYRLYGKRKWQ